MLFLQSGSEANEALFREALERNTHREVQGRARYWLAMYLKTQSECIPTLTDLTGVSDLRIRFEKMWGKEAVDRLQAEDPRKLVDEAVSLFSQAIEQYGDVGAFGFEKQDDLLRDLASRELHELRELTPGCVSPDIVGQDSDGKPLCLRDYRGNVVLLTFSANWCAPCRAMYSHKRELIQNNGGKPFVVLSVNADVDRETLMQAIDDGEITWRCWWDRPPRSICKEWNVTSFPTIYVIDHTGVIRYKNVRDKALDDAVNELLLEVAQC